MASDATDSWQSCCETVTQGCVTLWSEPAASIFRWQNKERSQCLPPFVSLHPPPPAPPPFPSFVIPSFSFHQQATLLLYLPLILSPLFPLTIPFHHPLHPVTKADSLLWLHRSTPPTPTQHTRTHTHTFSLPQPPYSHSLFWEKTRVRSLKEHKHCGYMMHLLNWYNKKSTHHLQLIFYTGYCDTNIFL